VIESIKRLWAGQKPIHTVGPVSGYSPNITNNDIKCGNDGAAERPRRDVVDVCHLAVEQHPVAGKERSHPSRLRP